MYKGHNSLILTDMLSWMWALKSLIISYYLHLHMFLPEGSCQVMALDIIYIISIVIEPIKYSCDSYNKPVNLLENTLKSYLIYIDVYESAQCRLQTL